MGWMIRKLSAAVIAGVGWKLGADAYDAFKRRFHSGSDAAKSDREKNVREGAEQRHPGGHESAEEMASGPGA